MARTTPSRTFVISALRARSNFGRLLRRVEEERHSLIIEKRGTPRAVLISLRDYVRLAAPEPEVLRLIGEEADAAGISRLGPREIERIIALARAKTRARAPKTRRK